MFKTSDIQNFQNSWVKFVHFPKKMSFLFERFPLFLNNITFRIANKLQTLNGNMLPKIILCSVNDPKPTFTNDTFNKVSTLECVSYQAKKIRQNHHYTLQNTNKRGNHAV